MISTHKLPKWVSIESRGLFKDEMIKKLGSEYSTATSWLSSWKPKDERSKLHFSYMKKNNEEIVSRSKAFVTGELPTKKKCIICYKKFLMPTWVCFVYKFKDGITTERINDSRHLACIYHFECKGVFNERKLKRENIYEETDDYDESEFKESYDEFFKDYNNDK